MSAPLVPSPLDYIGGRRFAFYPAIVQPDPNEWLLGLSSRSEVQVINAQTGRELWVLRQYIGAVSETGEALLVVGLTKALAFRRGSVEPKVKRVIEMPASREPANLALRIQFEHSEPARVVAIRTEPKPGSALARALFTTCVGALVIALLGALIAAAIEF